MNRETTTTIPTLETERLLLRGHRLDDFETYRALWSDADVVRYITGSPMSREQVWGRLMRIAGMWHHMGFGFFAIEEKATGRFIGEAGFHDLHREMTPSIEGTLETGWALMRDCHGKGYATELLQALLAWGEENFPEKRMTCIISPENTASIRLAGKMGFRETARTDYHGETILMERSRSAG